MVRKSYRIIFDRSQNEQLKKLIEERNAAKFPAFTIVGFAFALATFLFSFYDGGMAFRVVGGLFLLFFMVIHFFYGRFENVFHRTDGTLIMRTLFSVVLVFSVLLGTICMANDVQTVVFFLSLLVFPQFVLDYPPRIIKRITLAVIFFVFMSFAWKTREVFLSDFEHCMITYVASIFAYLYNIEGSYREMDGIVKAKYESEHHVLTGLRNKYGLQSAMDSYEEVNIAVIMMDLDNFKFFNDMYGHQMGDDVITAFGTILKEVFGEDNCYSYGGDEFLIVEREHDKGKLQKQLGTVKKRLYELNINGIDLHPSFSGGCAYGWNKDASTFNNFVTYADILLYQVKAMKKGSFRYVEYDGGTESLAKVQKEMNHISRAALTDALTNLPNMEFFRIRSESFLKNVGSSGLRQAFLYFNISNLKAFNEQNGFYEGDNLIKFVADTLKRCFPDDLISRFAEDHFVILTRMDGVEEKLTEAREAVRKHAQTGNVDLKAGVYPYQDGVKIDTACDYAKIACDSLKKQFDVFMRVFDDTLDQQNKNTQYVVSNFERAIREKWIRVFYQPIAGAMTGKIAVMEALSRWQDPVYGLMSPAMFIPVLEEHKLIRKLDLYMIEEVMKEAQKREAAGIGYLPITVNISRNDFENFDIAEYIANLSEKYQYDRKKLIIEITESALSVNTSFLKKQVNKFREYGFPVWMDDYGSGYSSLNTLREFDFDAIKLDMMFMKNYHGDEKSRIIIQQTISMATKLGLRTLTEGIENEEQMIFINEIGCEFAQGYLISKPHPLEEIVSMMEKEVLLIEGKDELDYYKKFASMDLRNPNLDEIGEGTKQNMQGLPTAVAEIKDRTIIIRRMNGLYKLIMDRRLEIGVAVKDGHGVYSMQYQENSKVDTLIRMLFEKKGWSYIYDSIPGYDSNAVVMAQVLDRNPVNGAAAIFIVVVDGRTIAENKVLSRTIDSLTEEKS